MDQRSIQARIILEEMFAQREYTDTSEIVIEEKLEREQVKINLLIATKPNEEKICAFTDVIPKLNVNRIKFCLHLLAKQEITHGLLIIDESTPQIKLVISEASQAGLELEIFPVQDLQYNITKHKLVPLHQALTKKESRQFKTKYGAEIQVLLFTDPVRRFYNFAKGDIIKITRQSGFITYRIVK